MSPWIIRRRTTRLQYTNRHFNKLVNDDWRPTGLVTHSEHCYPNNCNNLTHSRRGVFRIYLWWGAEFFLCPLFHVLKQHPSSPPQNIFLQTGADKSIFPALMVDILFSPFTKANCDEGAENCFIHYWFSLIYEYFFSVLT